ncbi:hypothetical protein QBC47DRAFT_406894 [Echria macrotheca]|uniref:Uncharacterized protein n=1 Tax=Echria macrotheca TaxID=438768 RepID=A0AAJ0B5G9_9PEZI|nr:hypothetical protein QBC47DRAFT_406894 [Echria macrotheca]
MGADRSVYKYTRCLATWQCSLIPQLIPHPPLLSFDPLETAIMRFLSLVALASVVAAGALPASMFGFDLEKRCQGADGSLCDTAALRCCAGLYCCGFNRNGIGGRCKNDPVGNPDPNNCV